MNESILKVIEDQERLSDNIRDAFNEHVLPLINQADEEGYEVDLDLLKYHTTLESGETIISYKCRVETGIKK